MSLFPEEDFEAEVQRWRNHRGTPPFVPTPAYQEAQRRQNGDLLQNLLRISGLQSTVDSFQSDVDDVSRGRLPRQLVKVGEQALGAYNNPLGGVVLPRIPKFTSQRAMQWVPEKLDFRAVDVPVPSGQYATMAETMLENPALGGIGQKINGLRRMLQRLAEDSAGQTGTVVKSAKTMRRDPIADELIEMASGGKKSAKSAAPAVRTIGNKVLRDPLPVQVARPGTMTDTPMEKMYAAMIDPKTGQVIHTRTAYRAGDHGGLETQAAVMEGFNGVRGFVDPVTMQAFTEAMLEEALLRSKGYY
jgi:hypothetical protein